MRSEETRPDQGWAKPRTRTARLVLAFVWGTLRARSGLASLYPPTTHRPLATARNHGRKWKARGVGTATAAVAAPDWSPKEGSCACFSVPQRRFGSW